MRFSEYKLSGETWCDLAFSNSNLRQKKHKSKHLVLLENWRANIAVLTSEPESLYFSGSGSNSPSTQQGREMHTSLYAWPIYLDSNLIIWAGIKKSHQDTCPGYMHVDDTLYDIWPSLHDSK